MGNVTNVETVTYFYEDCPVVSEAAGPTITVVRSHPQCFLIRRMSLIGYRPTRKAVRFSD